MRTHGYIVPSLRGAWTTVCHAGRIGILAVALPTKCCAHPACHGVRGQEAAGTQDGLVGSQIHAVEFRRNIGFFLRCVLRHGAPSGIESFYLDLVCLDFHVP